MAFSDLELIWYIRGVEVLTLVIASVLVIFAYRGYKKGAGRGFLLAATGFALLGAASLVEGLLFDVFRVPLDEAHAVRSTLTAIGLVVLLYSIYRTR